MKQHKIRMFAVLLLVGAILNGYQASASDVHIHCNDPSLSEQHFVSDIAEDDESIYFRITDASSGYSTHIIELKASGSECYIYTPKEYGLSADTFIDMEPGDSGQLWTTLRGEGNHYYIALFGEGQLLAMQECESRPAIGKSGAGWESENGFLFWDGTQTMALPYSSESESIGAFAVWNGGLAIHGGIIAGLLFIIYYCKKHEVNIWKMLDIIVVGLIIAQAIGRWGNFFNSEAYGPITTAADLKSLGIPQFIINGMYILGDYRQPTFFYESVWCFFGFCAMLLIRKYKYLKIGQLTGFYLLWYGIIRLIIEGMRTDSLMLGPIKMAQLVSIVFIIAGIIIFIRSVRKKENDLYNT